MVLTQPLLSGGIRSDLNRLFHTPAFGAAQSSQPGFTSSLSLGTNYGPFVPSTNVAEAMDAVIVTVELPGVELDRLNLRIENGTTLVLDGYRESGGNWNGQRVSYHLTEGRFGQIRWACQIPQTVDPSRIRTALSGGLLTIVMPKHQAAAAFTSPVTNVVINPGAIS